MATGLVADGKEPGSVRPAHLQSDMPGQRELRRRLERLEGLPLRAESARWALESALRDQTGCAAHSSPPASSSAASFRLEPDVDPGWVLAAGRMVGATGLDPLQLVATRPWWPIASRAVSDALGRLWRHAVAAGLAVARLAREAGRTDAEPLARAGFLHQLGAWCVTAVEPEWLPRWLAVEGNEERRAFERSTLGTELIHVARSAAERWRLDPLIVEAAWLHEAGWGAGHGSSADPRALALVQQAHQIAEQTPWALRPRPGKDRMTHDPRIKILMAEVQSRCRGAFLDPEATPREERLTHENARLRITLAAMSAAQASRDRLLGALAESDSNDSPDTWAERAARAWCEEPGVSAARLEWDAPAAPTQPAPPEPPREPSHVIPLQAGPRTVATLKLWTGDEPGAAVPALGTTLAAWRSWAVAIDDRARLARRLEGITATLRDRAGTDEPRLRKAKLDALAEFAAGAGHELNNPLAVIVGRAQLLLARVNDPAAIRSLRAILAQAQRAHRILRDLMYVARPPEPRLRPCTPDDIWRASLREARPEADERGITLLSEGFDQNRRVWTDPDGLRHLADSLLRNALEATPRGGTVRVASSGNALTLRWSVHDSGRGLTPDEAEHLFDPFFCGRQAGRGLGLGLPRAARFAALAGGEIQWSTVPGQGASFLVRLRPTEPPRPPGISHGPPNEPTDSRRATA